MLLLVAGDGNDGSDGEDEEAASGVQGQQRAADGDQPADDPATLWQQVIRAQRSEALPLPTILCVVAALHQPYRSLHTRCIGGCSATSGVQVPDAPLGSGQALARGSAWAGGGFWRSRSSALQQAAVKRRTATATAPARRARK